MNSRRIGASSLVATLFIMAGGGLFAQNNLPSNPNPADSTIFVQRDTVQLKWMNPLKTRWRELKVSKNPKFPKDSTISKTRDIAVSEISNNRADSDVVSLAALGAPLTGSRYYWRVEIRHHLTNSSIIGKTWFFLNSSPGEISGMIFSDVDGDGKRDTVEPILPDWEVVLNDRERTVSDTSGRYRFVIGEAGTYVLTATKKPDWQQTYPPIGSRAIPIGVDANGNLEKVPDKNFGFQFMRPCELISPINNATRVPLRTPYTWINHYAARTVDLVIKDALAGKPFFQKSGIPANPGNNQTDSIPVSLELSSTYAWTVVEHTSVGNVSPDVNVFKTKVVCSPIYPAQGDSAVPSKPEFKWMNDEDAETVTIEIFEPDTSGWRRVANFSNIPAIAGSEQTYAPVDPLSKFQSLYAWSITTTTSNNDKYTTRKNQFFIKP